MLTKLSANPSENTTKRLSDFKDTKCLIKTQMNPSASSDFQEIFFFAFKPPFPSPLLFNPDLSLLMELFRVIMEVSSSNYQAEAHCLRGARSRLNIQYGDRGSLTSLGGIIFLAFKKPCHAQKR